MRGSSSHLDQREDVRMRSESELLLCRHKIPRNCEHPLKIVDPHRGYHQSRRDRVREASRSSSRSTGGSSCSGSPSASDIKPPICAFTQKLPPSVTPKQKWSC